MDELERFKNPSEKWESPIERWADTKCISVRSIKVGQEHMINRSFKISSIDIVSDAFDILKLYDPLFDDFDEKISRRPGWCEIHVRGDGAYAVECSREDMLEKLGWDQVVKY